MKKFMIVSDQGVGNMEDKIVIFLQSLEIKIYLNLKKLNFDFSFSLVLT